MVAEITKVNPMRFFLNIFPGDEMKKVFCQILLPVFLIVFLFSQFNSNAWGTEGEPRFDIHSFEFEGNVLFSDSDLETVVKPFTGTAKTAKDVEAARDRLEKFYHTGGYPTALVNIPEQSVEEGTVRLEIIESKIRRVRVTGNRYFTMDKILKDLSSLKPGTVLYLPDVKKDLAGINRNPDLKVAPVLMPGKEPGTIDVELKVKDKMPLHGSLELNNRYTANTTDLRLNALIRYDNLWQKEHSVSFQYQTSPEDFSEVQSISTAYILPAPWEDSQTLLAYGLWSDSKTAFGEGFQVVGKGFIFGARDISPLPDAGDYRHNASVGFDYKDFKDDIGAGNDEDGIEIPIRYAPISLGYNGSFAGKRSATSLSGSLNFILRGLIDGLEDFEEKRYGSKGNFLYLTLGLENRQKMPLGLELFLNCDGQIADQPLISNEQYTAGGMMSVRGYRESEASGDNAVHGTIELSKPEFVKTFFSKEKIGLIVTPYLFYDLAAVYIKEALDDEDDRISLAGTGAGVRGSIGRFFEYDINGAIALSDTEGTDEHDKRINFIVKAKY